MQTTVVIPSARRVDQLEARIIELDRGSSHNDAVARAEIGGLLHELRAQLEPAAFRAWIDESTSFTPRTGDNYIDLYDFSKKEPQLFRSLAPLGPTKLYLLARLDPKRRGVLIERKQHVVPDTGQKRTLYTMKGDELLKVLGTLPGGAAKPVASALITLRRRVHALATAADDAIAQRRSIPPDAVEHLHDVLLDAAERLATAFGFEDGA